MPRACAALLTSLFACGETMTPSDAGTAASQDANSIDAPPPAADSDAEPSDAGTPIDEPDAAEDLDAAPVDAASPSDSEAPMDGASSSPGCGAAAPSADSLELEHDGLARTALVHVPIGYDANRPTPLVLAFHGYGQSAAEMRSFSQLTEVADREGFIAVFPEGTGFIRSWNGGTCCGTAIATAVDDVGFAGAIIDRLEDMLCVDTLRVYATGMSNGGFLAHRLACELSGRITAIAPVAGVIGMTSCSPSRPVPVLQFHGTADLVVPYLGNGFAYPSVASTVDDWVMRNRCSSGPTTYFERDDVECEAWSGCANEVEVRLCTVSTGGHTWPGGLPLPLLGRTTDTISASDEMWSFFERYALP